MGITERREREREQRRQTIIDAAEKIFFSKGIEAATMDEIAEAAELSKGTLYLYFKSREDLYFAVTKRGLDILSVLFQEAFDAHQTGIEKVRAIGKSYCTFAHDYPDYFKAQIYFGAHAADVDIASDYAQSCAEQGEIVLNILADALQCGIEDGSIRKDLNPKKTAIILWGTTRGVLQFSFIWSKHMNAKFDVFGFKSLNDIIEEAFDLIGYSLATR